MTDYLRYIVDTPLCEPGQTEEANRQSTQTYISNDLIPGCNYHFSMGWLYGLPDPARHIFEHVHPYDELVMHWGGDYRTPRVLGGEVEFYAGGQSIRFNTGTAFYLPGGTSHGPVTWLQFEYPHLQMALRVGNGDREDDNDNGMKIESDKNPVKQDDVDYERLIVRNPIYASATDDASKQATRYVSKQQVPEANVTFDIGWRTEQGQDAVPVAATEKNARIVAFIGSDYRDRADLGADIEIQIGDASKTVTTSAAVFVPRNTEFSVNVQTLRRPYTEIALSL